MTGERSGVLLVSINAKFLKFTVVNVNDIPFGNMKEIWRSTDVSKIELKRSRRLDQ
jgi:hypothetical protein